jgi:hypothetical protein
MPGYSWRRHQLAILTGASIILAWQFQREAETEEHLLLHLVLAGASSVLIWLVWWLHFRARRP